MSNVFEEYRESLAETMLKLSMIQAQLNIATADIQTNIDRNQELLRECERNAPAAETWMDKLLRRKN